MMPVKMRDQLMDPSGGLVWHLRAWKNITFWHPFQHAVEQWLQNWFQTLPPHCNALVLVGPSAGWTLPLSSLRCFAEITAFEPDILARQILKYRLQHAALSFDKTDIFSPGGMEYLSTHFGSHAILFCNVLGQLAPEDPIAAERWCQVIIQTLSPCHWASYHDLFSTRNAPARVQAAREFSAGTALEVVLSSYWRESEIEICDHGTSTFGMHHAFRCIPWRLRKNQWHMVQWVSHYANSKT